MSKTTTKSLAANIRETLEDGSYTTIASTTNATLLKLGDGNPSRRTAHADAAATLRNAGIYAIERYRPAHGWHIIARRWA